jgi:hypothetical protein
MKPKLLKWAYPTDQELAEISPEDSYVSSIEIKTESFLKSLEQFEGLFQSAKWRYEQVKVAYDNADLRGKDKEILFHFDDMATEVREYVPVESVDSSVKSLKHEFILPCIHVKKLSGIISRAPAIKLSFNDLDPSDPHGMTAILSAEKLTLVLAKLLE